MSASRTPAPLFCWPELATEVLELGLRPHSWTVYVRPELVVEIAFRRRSAQPATLGQASRRSRHDRSRAGAGGVLAGTRGEAPHTRWRQRCGQKPRPLAALVLCERCAGGNGRAISHHRCRQRCCWRVGGGRRGLRVDRADAPARSLRTGRKISPRKVVGGRPARDSYSRKAGAGQAGRRRALGGIEPSAGTTGTFQGERRGPGGSAGGTSPGPRCRPQSFPGDGDDLPAGRGDGGTIPVAMLRLDLEASGVKERAERRRVKEAKCRATAGDDSAVGPGRGGPATG